jgi:cytidylate kinase
MAVITISRQFGAGGITLGRMLAERLGYSFADEEIIQMVAKQARVSPEFVESIEKEAGGKLQRLISSLVPRRIVDTVLSDERGYIDEEIYVDLLGVIIAKLADEGNAVIIGRGGQYFLKNREGILHVLLVADKEHRVSFVEKKYGLSLRQAEQFVSTQDKRRVNLYRKFHKMDFDQPAHYHLVLNTSILSLERAADVVCALVAG